MGVDRLASDTVTNDMLATTAMFALSFHAWSNRRKVNTTPQGIVGSALAADRIRSTMTLIKSAPYDAIKTYLTDTRTWFLGRSMPTFMFRGIFFVKLAVVSEFEDKIKDVRRWLADEGVPALLEDYGRAMDEASNDYRVIARELNIANPFNAKDYPTREELRSAFGIDHSWVSFGVPANLPDAVRADEEIKIRAKFAEATVEVTAALREMFGALVTHATDRLTDDGGKPKVFRASMIENFKEFFATFDTRNLTNDTELAALVAQARSLLSGTQYSVGTLRNSPGARASVAEKLGVIQAAVDELIATAPGRKFDFED